MGPLQGIRLDLLVESLALALLKAKRPGREREMQKSSLHPDPTLQGALRLGMDVGAWAEPVVLLLVWGKPRTSPDFSCPQSLFNSKYWRRANI